ncbi:MAG: DUF4251 domain-containing protein [Fulvivirga sp.]|nr:DUF4251 domain-containing protein [Fulvivirga sp.]
MKTLRINQIVMAMLLLFITGVAYGQEEKSKKQLKKEQKKEQLEANIKVIKKAVRDSAFVIEADMLRGRHSRNIIVTPNTNFVKVNGDEIILQTADAFSIGYNGLGGVTIDGTIQTYEIFEDEHSVRLTIQFSSPMLGFSTVDVVASANGTGRATLRTNVGGYVEFKGEFSLIETSSTYEGVTLY